MDWRMMVKYRGRGCDGGKGWDHTVRLIMNNIKCYPKDRSLRGQAECVSMCQFKAQACIL